MVGWFTIYLLLFASSITSPVPSGNAIIDPQNYAQMQCAAGGWAVKQLIFPCDAPPPATYATKYAYTIHIFIFLQCQKVGTLFWSTVCKQKAIKDIIYIHIIQLKSYIVSTITRACTTPKNK